MKPNYQGEHPSNSFARQVYGAVSKGIWDAFEAVVEAPTDDLLYALEALSALRGTLGTFPREVTMTLIRNEIERRAGQ